MYEHEFVLETEIENLNSILRLYRRNERKKKRIFAFIMVLCAVAMYFLLFDLLGGIWGCIATIAIIGVVAFLVSKLWISFKKISVSDERHAYQACLTMAVLIEIKKGIHRNEDILIGPGGHYYLYRQFIEMYPEYMSKDLEKLSKIEIKLTDI